ncbi:MAG: hypothetical protein ABF296_02325 [Oceanococcaceae bacterium]
MTFNPNSLPRNLAEFASAHARGGFAFSFTNTEFAAHLRAIQPGVSKALHGWLEEEATLCELDPDGVAPAEDRATIAAKLCAACPAPRRAGHKALTHVRVSFRFDQGLTLAIMECCIGGVPYVLTEVVREDGSIDDGPGRDELALPSNADAVKAAEQCGVHLYEAMSAYIEKRLDRFPRLRRAVEASMSGPPDEA